MRPHSLPLVRAALTALAALLLPAGSVAQQPPRPNVVLIITDDLGYGDLGSYGATDIRTPHLDRLAREGARLTQFYANGTNCTPTRTGLITGRWQQRVNLEYPLGMQRPADYDRGLAPTGHTLPQLMKNAGYRTALVGKWHLGWKPQFSPNRHGFDYFFGLKAGFHDFYTHTTPDSPEPGGHDLFENDSAVHVSGYTTDLITERSVRFIEQNTGRPFFIDVAYNAPHWPYQVPDNPSVARDSARHLRVWDDSTSTRADYAAMVERVDDGVGRILATLDRLGLREKTIVIFTNDNGGEWLSRNAPFFHHKSTVWEGGIRVPMIVRWPGRIEPGTVSHQVGITMDLTRSILAAARAELPPELTLDGIDILSILAGRAPETERTLYWRLPNPARRQAAVRSGDWKLVLDGGSALLFNLRNDVGERENLVSREPATAKRLYVMYQRWEQEVTAEARATMLANQGGAPRPAAIQASDSTRPATTPPAAYVRIASGSRGATLYIDDKVEGLLSAPRRIAIPGGVPVRLSIRAQGCTPWDTTVVVNAGATVTIGRKFARC